MEAELDSHSDGSCSMRPTTLGVCVPGRLRGLSLSLPVHVVTLLAGIGVEDLCNEVVQPRSLFVMHGSFVQLTWTDSSLSHSLEQGVMTGIHNGGTFWLREGQGHGCGV